MRGDEAGYANSWINFIDTYLTSNSTDVYSNRDPTNDPLLQYITNASLPLPPSSRYLSTFRLLLFQEHYGLMSLSYFLLVELTWVVFYL